MSTEYNTQQKKLPLLEYGRSVQRMVDHALTLTDRDKRQQCAETIVSIMADICNASLDNPEDVQRLWNHLYIMSSFELDVDYPVELVPVEKLTAGSQVIPYSDGNVRYRHYGRLLPAMVMKAVQYKDGDEKDQLVLHIANQMKRNFSLWNKDGVDDKQIFNDLLVLSQGQIDLTESGLHLESVQLTPESKQYASNGSKRRKGR